MSLLSLDHWTVVLIQLLAITLGSGKQPIYNKKFFLKIIKQLFLNHFYTVGMDIDVWFWGSKHQDGGALVSQSVKCLLSAWVMILAS